MTPEQRSWDLSHIKVGDLVAYYHGGWTRQIDIVPVEKVYKTHLLVLGLRFRKSTGWEAGDGYTKGHIAAITDETRQEIEDLAEETRRRRVATELRETNWQSFSATVLDSVKAIVVEALAQRAQTKAVQG